MGANGEFAAKSQLVKQTLMNLNTVGEINFDEFERL